MNFIRHPRFCFKENEERYRIAEYTPTKVVVCPILMPSFYHTYTLEEFERIFWCEEPLRNFTN